MTNFFARLRDAFRQPPAELVRVHQQTRARFSYVKQHADEWKQGRVLKAFPDGPFQGDCDDFAATVAFLTSFRLETSLYTEVNLPRVGQHAVCIYKGWVSDNLQAMPYPLSHLRGPVRVSFSVFDRLKMTALGYRLEIQKTT